MKLVDVIFSTLIILIFADESFNSIRKNFKTKNDK